MIGLDHDAPAANRDLLTWQRERPGVLEPSRDDLLQDGLQPRPDRGIRIEIVGDADDLR